MKHLGLFEGIGGFSLAARWMGWETVAWCEWNEFGQKVLKHHFPEAEGHGDITKTDFTKYANTIDIITGGFPCQPYSNAGKRLGKADERHLWPEMLRAIREIQPRYVVAENVSGLISWNGGMVFNEVQVDLETAGYEVFPFVLPACAVNAPHRRDRVWFIAYNNSSTTGSPRKSGSVEINRSKNNDEQKQRGEQTELNTGSHELLRDASNTDGSSIEGQCECRQREREFRGCHCENNATHTIGSRRVQDNEQQPSGKFEYVSSGWQRFPTQSPVCNGDDGISGRLVGVTFPKWRNESIKAMGNAIVPQVAFQIFKAINLIKS
jgi:DNA (cytosine-5)-methyltransferase 1